MLVSCLITEFFFFMSDIKEDYDLSGYIPDFPFPVAACKVTQCSTFAVVCRLKSHRHVVTSQKSELVWPEFPPAKVTFPKNAVPQEKSFEVTAKVGMARVNYPCIYIFLARGITKYLGLRGVGGTGNRSNRNIEALRSLAFPS